jgi:predicted permease
MDRIVFELRLAFRRLNANKSFSAIAILSLAFGIGATTVFFSLVNSTLLKPLPGVERPGELYSLADPRYGAPVLSYPNYRDIRDRNTAFAGVIGYRIAPVNASLAPGSNSRVWGYLVSGNYFEVLGVRPARGRLLTPEDDVKRGGHPVIVISHRSWQTRFAGASDIIGRTIKLNSSVYTIVGVAPEGFQGTERFYAPELFVPMSMNGLIEPGSNYLDNRNTENTFILARLKQGVTVAQASAALDALTAKLAEEWPTINEGMKIKLVEPGWAGDMLRGGVIGFSTVLIAVAGLLLLVVCVNLASLLLAQASERKKEIAVRLAIGASRGLLIRQLLLETLTLSLIGGTIGVLGAFWAVSLISNLKPPVDFALETSITIDWRVLIFSASVSALASIVFGLTPAWQATRTDLVAALKNDLSDARARRWPLRDLMVGAQITLSVVLLAASGLMLGSLQNALTIDLGFNPRNAATLGFDVAIQGYPEEKGKQFLHDLARRAQDMPGVKSTALASTLPLDIGFSNTGVWDTEQPKPTPSQIQSAEVFFISPDFFQTMQTRLIAGREFAPNDDEKAPRRLVVNETFTRQILHLARPELAVGKRATLNDRIHEIIGVAADGKYTSLSEAPKAVMFQALWQSYSSNVRLVARTSGNDPDLLRRMHQLVQAMDPEMTLYGEETLEQHMNLPLLPSRVAAGALTVFGSVTLALAAIGIYGVMAFAVSRRTREIGIRMAIGATPWQIASMIGKRAVWLVGVSALVGTVLALLAAGQLSPILLGVNPWDPMVHLLGLALIGAIAFAACWRPARRAASLDPSQSLRRD